MRRLIAAALALGLSATVPAASGADTPLLSDNVRPIANVPDVLAIGGKIVQHEDGRSLLYTTTLKGLTIYDVTLGVPVPIGALPLPHWQNEWVDTNGKILLIAADHFLGSPSMVYIIDVEIPHAPILRSAIAVSNAHTATCIQDCRFFWTRGGDVVDLSDPSAPRNLGSLPYQGHHVGVDETGLAWIDGRYVVDTNDYGLDNALNPTLVAAGGSFGWHGMLRPDASSATPQTLANGTIDPGELVLGTDENWLAIWNDVCANEGPFITSWYRTVNGQPRVERLDTWSIRQGTVPGSKPAGAMCSSHWFDYHDDIVTIGWYEQGVRFLDVSDPHDIRQIGYYMPGVTEAWGARFHHVTDGPLPGLYVYTFDVVGGMDVLLFDGEAGDATVLAPRYNPIPVLTERAIQPHPEYGWACRIGGVVPA